MNPRPLLTVITICYNSSKYIAETLESVLGQSDTDFEYLVVDDHSTDQTWAIIQRYQPKGLTAIQNERNLGEYANRAKALRHAQGEYVIFIDGDDRMYPHAVQGFRYYLSHIPGKAMYCMQSKGDPRFVVPLVISPKNIYRFEFLDNSVLGNDFTKVIFQRSVLLAYGWPQGMVTGDTYIQLKIAQQYELVLIPGEFTWWRRRAGNATEQYFSHISYVADTLRFQLQLLGAECPLDPREVIVVKTKLFGYFLRRIIKLVLFFQFYKAYLLLRKVQVPVRYWTSFLYRKHKLYFAQYSGDYPASGTVFQS